MGTEYDGVTALRKVSLLFRTGGAEHTDRAFCRGACCCAISRHHTTGWVSAMWWDSMSYKTVCLIWTILFCNPLHISRLQRPSFLLFDSVWTGRGNKESIGGNRVRNMKENCRHDWRECIFEEINIDRRQGKRVILWIYPDMPQNVWRNDAGWTRKPVSEWHKKHLTKG